MSVQRKSVGLIIKTSISVSRWVFYLIHMNSSEENHKNSYAFVFPFFTANPTAYENSTISLLSKFEIANLAGFS